MHSKLISGPPPVRRRRPHRFRRRGGRVAPALVVAGAASVALALPAPALALTFEPDPAVLDSVDAAPGDGVCANAEGRCSLRAAVMEANGGTTGSADTIVLSRGTYQLTIPEIDRGFPSDIDGDLNFVAGQPVAVVGIFRSGAPRATIEQTAPHRVLSVSPGADVDLSGVTVTGGDVTAGGGGIFSAGTLTVPSTLALHYARINGNRTEGPGGGILAGGGGLLELDHVAVRQNEAGTGGGILSVGPATMRFTTVRDNVARLGGGIFWGFSPGERPRRLELRNSLVAGNRAVGDDVRASGGGLAIRADGPFHGNQVQVVDTTIRGNHADRDGGGIHVEGFASALRVERSTLVANDATGEGGGVLLVGPGRFTNSTLSGNHADDGGAIFHTSSPVCFGFDCGRDELVLDSSTLAENRAAGGVDGIRGGGFFLLQAVGTIFANRRNCELPVNDSIGWNLETGTSCELDGPGDLSSTAPGLRPLADNGGATWTHALRAGSAAIDANAFSGCPRLDQRSAFRPAGERCDIGSFERDAAFLPTPLRPPEPRFIGGAADIELLPLFATSLAKEGISLDPAGGAEGDEQGTGLSLDIGGGKLRGGHASLELGGWLILRGPDRTLALSHPVAILNGRRGFLAMTLGLEGRRVRLFDLSGVQRGEPKGERVSLEGEAALSAAAASLLRREFGAKLPAGTEVGRLEADVALVPPTTDPGPIQEPVEPPGQ
jgi:hypothetical protein